MPLNARSELLLVLDTIQELQTRLTSLEKKVENLQGFQVNTKAEILTSIYERTKTTMESLVRLFDERALQLEQLSKEKASFIERLCALEQYVTEHEQKIRLLQKEDSVSSVH